MKELEWLGILRSTLTAVAILIIIPLGLIRVKQWPTYRKLLAFPHLFETVPLVRHLYFHFRMLWIEYRTGTPYSVLFWRDIFEFIESFRENGTLALYIGAQPNLVLFRADHIEKVLTSNTNISKGRVYQCIHPWLGLGLLTSTGSKWKARRKMLTPAFHFRILDRFANIMNQQAKIFVERMGAKPAAEDIVPYITTAALDIVCETIMGVKMNSQTTGSGRKYLNSLKSVGERLLAKVQQPTAWIEWIYNMTQASQDNARDLNELHSFTMNVINERKSELEANPEELDKMAATEDGLFKSRKPFLDMLLVEHMKHKTMSVADIREEVDTFMFEGHDTTSMGLTWAIYLLGLHPEVQTRIQNEIDEIFQDNIECEVMAEHIKQMKYLDLALKESQRIYPSVPVISRSVTDELEIDGKTVPVGTELTCNILLLHRDPNVFPDPLKYDPDRFLPANCIGRNPFAFVPFSAGPRNCIGQRFALLEEKIMIVWLLRKYNLRSLDPPEKIDIVPELVLLTKCPIRVQCIPRR